MRSISLYIKCGKVSVRMFVCNAGCVQLSSKWRYNQNDVIVRTGSTSAVIMRMTSQWQ